jgi:hypothetical protein
MLYAEIVAAYQAIEATTSRLLITEVLVGWLRAAPAPLFTKACLSHASQAPSMT